MDRTRVIVSTTPHTAATAAPSTTGMGNGSAVVLTLAFRWRQQRSPTCPRKASESSTHDGTAELENKGIVNCGSVCMHAPSQRPRSAASVGLYDFQVEKSCQSHHSENRNSENRNFKYYTHQVILRRYCKYWSRSSITNRNFGVFFF